VDQSERASGEATDNDLWFVGPKLSRPSAPPVPDPMRDRTADVEALPYGADGPDPIMFTGADDDQVSMASVTPPTAPKASKPVNKFAKVLPPMPELETDPSVDQALAGILHEESDGPPGPRLLYAYLGTALVVVVMVAVALALHPWAHTAVHR